MTGLAGLVVVLVTMAACRDALAPLATVSFYFDAPLCSSVVPVRFFIDGVPVGADTFRIRVVAEHLTSRAFAVPGGRHTVGAKTMYGVPSEYVWPDATVSLAAGSSWTDSLPFYCS